MLAASNRWVLADKNASNGGSLYWVSHCSRFTDKNSLVERIDGAGALCSCLMVVGGLYILVGGVDSASRISTSSVPSPKIFRNRSPFGRCAGSPGQHGTDNQFTATGVPRLFFFRIICIPRAWPCRSRGGVSQVNSSYPTVG